MADAPAEPVMPEPKRKALDNKLRNATSLQDVFQISCKFLSRHFPVKRASLATYDAARDSFTIEAVRIGSRYGFGVRFRLDGDCTLLADVKTERITLVEKYPYPDNCPYFESKIILGSDTRAVALIPLNSNGRFLGTFNVGSTDAFILEHYVETLFVDFSQALSRHLAK